MHISDVMTRDVFAVAPDTSIETAARLLSNRHITGAPVVSSGGKPVGVVTLADLVDPDRPRSERDGYPLFYVVGSGTVEELGEDVRVGTGRVSDVMSPFVLSIESTATLREAATRLVEEEVHRLLVMDGGKLVGIASSLDILRGMAREAA
jgi:CBS domain-containing protein